MPPPEQRLRAHDATSLRLDDRLVVEHQLLAGNRLSEAALEGQPLRRLLVHGGGVELESVLPFILRPVERGPRVLEQGLLVGPVLRKNARPHAQGHEQLAPLDLEGGLHGLEELDRDLARLLDAPKPAHEQGELVAPEPGEGVALAYHRLDAPPRLVKDPVSHRVAEGVVDDLEAVEVHEEHGHLAFVPPRAGEGDGEAIEEELPVRQLGERVVVGHVLGLAGRAHGGAALVLEEAGHHAHAHEELYDEVGVGQGRTLVQCAPRGQPEGRDSRIAKVAEAVDQEGQGHEPGPELMTAAPAPPDHDRRGHEAEGGQGRAHADAKEVPQLRGGGIGEEEQGTKNTQGEGCERSETAQPRRQGPVEGELGGSEEQGDELQIARHLSDPRDEYP